MLFPAQPSLSENPLLEEDSIESWLTQLSLVERTDNSSGANEMESTRGPAQTEPPLSEPNTVSESLLLTVARSAMACEFEVLLNQFQYPKATELALDALDLVDRLESHLSVYQPHSDLSGLNRWGAEKYVPVGEDTLQLLALAHAVHQATGGAFDITSGLLSEVWGFSRRSGRKPSADEIEEALNCVGMQFVELELEMGAARFLRNGLQINPGGIGKGYALDRAGRRLFDAGIRDFMIHGGRSSVAAVGNRSHPETGGGWLVALKHPWRWEEPLGMIRLEDQALATSGSGKQFFHFGGQRYSHIIDPRSGWPAQSMMSCTVICASGAVADSLATAFFVMGPDLTREFCAVHPAIAAILIYQDSKTGKQTLETCNVQEGNWLPHGTAANKNSS